MIDRSRPGSIGPLRRSFVGALLGAALCGTPASAAIASVQATASPVRRALDGIVRASGRGTSVTIRFRTVAARGRLRIAAAGLRPFESTLAALGVPSDPHEHAAIPANEREACGAPSNALFLPLHGAAHPLVVLYHVVGAKGCFPIAHVFAADETARRYAALPTAALAGSVLVPPLTRVRSRSERLHVDAVRSAVAPLGADEPIAPRRTFTIVDARTAAGAPRRFAIERLARDAEPAAGSWVLLDAANGEYRSIASR